MDKLNYTITETGIGKQAGGQVELEELDKNGAFRGLPCHAASG
jgi:hypothetical protein